MPMLPSIALNSLLTHPKSFLEKYPVRVAGMPGQSGTVTYYFDNKDYGNPQRPGKILGTSHMHDTEGFSISNVPIGHAFQAYNIAMAPSDVAPIAMFTLPAIGGPAIMVTGALSGCSFIVNQGGAPGSLDCAHLQPKGETGTELNNRLVPNHDAVYGRNDYGHLSNPHVSTSYDRTVTIIGVRRNLQWKVYTQKLDKQHSWSIRSVHRLYP